MKIKDTYNALFNVWITPYNRVYHPLLRNIEEDCNQRILTIFNGHLYSLTYGEYIQQEIPSRISELFLVTMKTMIQFSFVVTAHWLRQREIKTILTFKNYLLVFILQFALSVLLKLALFLHPRIRQEYFAVVEREKLKRRLIAPFIPKSPLCKHPICNVAVTKSLKLPNELIERILLFCSDKDVFNFSQVSKGALSIASSESYLNCKVEDVFPPFIAKLVNLNKIVKKAPVSSYYLQRRAQLLTISFFSFDANEPFVWGRDKYGDYFLGISYNYSKIENNILSYFKNTFVLRQNRTTKAPHFSITSNLNTRNFITPLLCAVDYEDYLKRLFLGTGCGVLSIDETGVKEGPRTIPLGGIPTLELWKHRRKDKWPKGGFLKQMINQEIRLMEGIGLRKEIFDIKDPKILTALFRNSQFIKLLKGPVNS